MNNFEFCVYTYKHRRAFELVLEEILIKEEDKKALRERAIYHDMDKLIMYQFLDKKQASSLHRDISRHHLNNNLVPKTRIDLLETIVDFECAAYTKKDKPLNAYDTNIAYFDNNEDILNLLKELDLNYSYKVCSDKIINELKKYDNISEDDIKLEIMTYLSIINESL